MVSLSRNGRYGFVPFNTVLSLLSRFFRMRLFALLVVSVTELAWGWSSDSHKIVARIAARHIRSKTRRFVRQHLPGREGSWMGLSESALVQVSAWADQVLEDPAYGWSRELHFSDTPYRACDAYEETRDCGGGWGRCIVTAIANYTERAANIVLPHEQRAEAIKFLVHFVADAHSGLHVGFSEDAGGNGIHLRDPDMSLHEVWDSLLLDTFKDSLGVSSWVGVSSQLANMISGSTDIVHAARLTPVQLAVAGAVIASETATRVTCASAYFNNGAWISSGDSLGEEYLVDRSGVAIDRLVKAGLRLAQVLDQVAHSYYMQEQAAEAALVVAPADRVASNMFHPLEFDFDPEAYVFELSTDIPAEVDMATEVDGEEPPTVTPHVAPTATPERAAKRKSGKQRARLNKRKVEGVDVESLVLIKRGPKFYVTKRSSVESDAWLPTSIVIVSATFADSTAPIVFYFDGAVFGGGQLTPTLQAAVLRHLRGLAALPTAGLLESSTVEEVTRAHAGEEITAMGALLGSLSINPFVNAPYASVADYVRPPVPAKRLREMYGGRLPSDAGRQLDIITAEADGIVEFRVGKLVLLARARDLADHTQRRWVFNEFPFVDSRVSLTDIGLLYIDARLINEELMPPACERIFAVAGRRKNREKSREIERRRPPLMSRLSIVSEYFESDSSIHMSKYMAATFERMAVIERPGDSPFRTLEYVFRDEAGMRKATQLLGLKSIDHHMKHANPASRDLH